jgi:hypothetical protein
MTKLQVSNPDTQPKSKQSHPKNPNWKKNPKHTSKMRNYLKVFNVKLTKCNSASELLQTFMDQTSYKSDSYIGEVTTAATHLAGARKVNSVNYATCLHRLARFASDNHSSQDVDEWKATLSDPRFAMLLCSVAEMGSRVDASTSVRDAKAVVEKWEIDSTINIDAGMKDADDVLSNIVGVGINNGGSEGTSSMNEMDRRRELAETAMSQLIDPKRKSAFSSRECSNICWAVAKIRVAPPSNALALGRIADMQHEPGNIIGEERLFVNFDEMCLDVLSSCLKIRNQLFEEARRRKAGGSGGGGWIPELSRLAGKLMDLFAVQIIQDYSSRRELSDGEHITINSGNKKVFNPQEMASTLWAFAKAQRADDVLFAGVAEELLRQTAMASIYGELKPKPQEFANTLWAFATAGIRAQSLVKLIKVMADSLDEGNGEFFGGYFKPQEFANSGKQRTSYPMYLLSDFMQSSQNLSSQLGQLQHSIQSAQIATIEI